MVDENVWTQARIQSLIDTQTEENTELEYKSADALQKTDKSKSEIAKDVSAMANAAGGVIIYGVNERPLPHNKKIKLADSISPIDPVQFDKESLDQIISRNITPPVNVKIYPVTIDDDPSKVVYVVEVPQGTTAHQSRCDHKYHKRRNVTTDPMEDHEVRDVMGRQKHPKIELRLAFEVWSSENITNKLVIKVVNVGNVYAKYVQVFVSIPQNTLATLIDYERTIRDARRNEYSTYVEYVAYNSKNEIYTPVFPDTTMTLAVLNVYVKDIKEAVNLIAEDIEWRVYADYAPFSIEKRSIRDIPILD